MAKQYLDDWRRGIGIAERARLIASPVIGIDHHLVGERIVSADLVRHLSLSERSRSSNDRCSAADGEHGTFDAPLVPAKPTASFDVETREKLICPIAIGR